MSKYNPFLEVYEPNTKYKHARTLRSSLREKLGRTYYVFAGKSANSGQEHYGLSDYLTFIAIKIGRLAISVGYKAVITALFASIIGIPFIIPVALTYPVVVLAYVALAAVKLAAELALTMVAAPLVAVTHFFSWLAGRKDKAAVNNIKLNVVTSNRDEKSHLATERQLKLSEYLGNDSNLGNVHVQLSGTTQKLKVAFSKELNVGTNLMEDYFDPIEKSVVLDVSKDTAKKPVNADDRRAFKALLRLNVGGGNLHQQWLAIKSHAIAEHVPAFKSNNR